MQTQRLQQLQCLWLSDVILEFWEISIYIPFSNWQKILSVSPQYKIPLKSDPYFRPKTVINRSNSNAHIYLPLLPHLQLLSLYRLPPTISPHKLNKTAYARDSVQYSMAITLQEKDSSVTGTNTADVSTHNIRLIYGECFHRDTYGWRPPKMQYSRVAVRPAVIHLHSLTTSIGEHTNAHGKFMNQ